MGVRLPARGAITAAIIVVLALVAPAIAAPLSAPAPDPYPRVAFVARNDNPFDAMGIGPVAGALGGVIAITPTNSLSLAAATVLTEYDPDIVVIAGGPAAISPDVEQEIEDLGSWTVRRAQGQNRDETAREIARLIDELGLARPAMLSTSSGQNVGDLYLGGHFEAQTATIGGVDLPAHLPTVWSDWDGDAGTKYAPNGDGINQVFDLVVDIPADGGVLAVDASAAATNGSESGNSTIGLFLTIDEAATAPDFTPFYAATFGLSQDLLGANDAGSQLDSSFLSVEVQGTIPVTKGTHHVYLTASMQADAYLQIPHIRAVWYPSGTAEASGLTLAP